MLLRRLLSALPSTGRCPQCGELIDVRDASCASCGNRNYSRRL
jgi:predicted RNA-binding Zn-ribbon protein involved in translation (DUF1610 family)